MATNVTVGKSSGNGMGIATVVLIIFIVLKVLNVQPVASWSWFWVLSPIWIGFALFVAALALFGIGFLIYLAVEKIRYSTPVRRRRIRRERKRQEEARIERERLQLQRRARYAAQQAALRDEYGIDQ